MVRRNPFYGKKANRLVESSLDCRFSESEQVFIEPAHESNTLVVSDFTLRRDNEGSRISQDTQRLIRVAAEEDSQ